MNERNVRTVLCFVNKSKARCLAKVKKPSINGLNAYMFELTIFIRALTKQVAAHRYSKAEVSCLTEKIITGAVKQKKWVCT